MRKVLLALVIVVCGLTTNAQHTSFIKKLGEYTDKVYPADDGHFYIVSIRRNCGSAYIYISYMNKDGSLIRSGESGQYLSGYHSLAGDVNNDNNNLIFYFKSVSTHSLLEIDTSLNIVWTSNLQFITQPMDIKYTKLIKTQTAIYLCGTTFALTNLDTSKAIITKLTNQGNQIWTKQYEYPNGGLSTIFNDVIFDNNSLLVSGAFKEKEFHPPSQTGGLRPTVCRIDTNGFFLQGNYYMTDSVGFGIGFSQQEFIQIHKTPLGKYYLNSSLGRVIKLNSNLDVEWGKRRSGYVMAICAGYDEDVLLCPDVISNNGIVQLDSNGNYQNSFITKKNPSAYGSNDVTSMFKQECGLLIGTNGSMYARLNQDLAYCADSTNTDTWWHFIDLLGSTPPYGASYSLDQETVTNASTFSYNYTFSPHQMYQGDICDEQYNCSGAINVENFNMLEMGIFPNPSNATVRIELPNEIVYAEYEIALYNTLGQLVLMQQKKDMANNVDLNIQILPEGLYILHLKSKGVHMTEKLLIKR